MRPELVALFESSRVPRYTSYPTAPHFGPGVGPAEHAAWLAQLALDEPVSLYLHVPFCRQLCWYCGCTTHVAREQARIDAYTDLLAREIDLVAEHLPGRLPVAHLHWGGGTPSIVGVRAFGRLMAQLRRVFAFRDGAELAVELDPRVLEPQMVEALAAAGIDRASFGVQSFDPKVQAAINRHQPFELTRDAFLRLRTAGIRRLNADLLYGLPHQTVANCLDTVAKLVELAPDRVAVFGYAHLPRLKKHQRAIDEAALPDARARVEQHEAMGDALERAGYVRIGLDHFARPDDPMAIASVEGRLRRNFQGYTTDTAETLVGFGASAISSFPRGYVQNEVELRAWRQRVLAGSLPTARGVALRPSDLVQRAIIERIMCRGEVDLAEIAWRFGVEPAACEPDPARMAELLRHGIATRAGSRVRISDECRPLLRVLAAAFDRYLAPGAERHAVAV